MMQTDERTATARATVDLSGYPDLVMVLLGFRVGSLRGLPALMRIGRGLADIGRSPPDGLLGNDGMMFGWNHVGIRHYWRDLDSLGRFTRSAPHSGWWRDFLSDRHGCGFWHEAYSAKGGIEAIYVGIDEPVGLGAFAPARRPEGPFLSSRDRLTADARARRDVAA
jgi:hypothetical protein